MKKTIIFLLISAICLPLFAGCDASLPGIGNRTSSDPELEIRPPEDSSIHTELDGVYLTLESLTDTSISVVWHNDTDNQITFGEWYSIELWRDGEWVNMLKDEMMVPEIAILLMPHGENSKTYSTKPFDLSEPGLYRLRCEFYPGNGERKNTWVEFEVGEKGENELKITNTNLEFLIAENVDNVDFSGHQARYGIMGGWEYYGKGYTPSVAADGQQTDPEHCVIYTITSYPDYSSGKKHITRITITDPSVKVYGLTLDSPAEDIKQTMSDEGFEVKETASGITAEKGDFRFSFSDESITISVSVTNKQGIVY